MVRDTANGRGRARRLPAGREPLQTYQDAAGNVIYGGQGLGAVPSSEPIPADGGGPDPTGGGGPGPAGPFPPSIGSTDQGNFAPGAAQPRPKQKAKRKKKRGKHRRR